jgi:hypothetical protein
MIQSAQLAQSWRVLIKRQGGCGLGFEVQRADIEYNYGSKKVMRGLSDQEQ